MKNVPTTSAPLSEDEIEAPFLKNVFLAAGDGGFGDEEIPGTPVRFNARMLREQNITPSQVSCVQIHGNSMDPVLPDGTTVAVDTGHTSITDGDIYAIRQNGMLRIKLVHRLPGSGLRLKSFNETEHPEETYLNAAQLDIEIIGRVFWYSVMR